MRLLNFVYLQKKHSMNSILLSFLLVINPFQVKEVNRLDGKVIDNKSNPIGFVTIVNISLNKATYSSVEGDFIIDASIGDTLIMTCLGFVEKEIIVTNSDLYFMTVDLVERLYDIEQVVVYNLGTYQQFKNKILYMKLPPDKIAILKEKILGNINFAKSSYRAPISGTPNVLLPSGGGISFGSGPKRYDIRVKELNGEKWKSQVYQTKITELAASLSSYKSDTLILFQAFCLKKTSNKDNLPEYELAKIIKGLKIVFEQTILCKK